MKGTRMLAAIVLTLGILALIYGGFTYTKDTHEAQIGPIGIQVKDREHVNVPVWLGVTATVIGGSVLLFGRSKPA